MEQRRLGRIARTTNLARRRVGDAGNPLGGAFKQARRMMALTRGAAAAEAKRTVRVELSKHSLASLAAAAAESHTAATLTKSRVSAFAMYTRFCLSTGETEAAVPITLSRAQAYCTWAVSREGQTLASHSLKQAVSNLRVALATWGSDWAGKCLILLMDSLPAFFNFNKARGTDGLRDDLVNIYELLERNDILAMALYVPREWNDLPDAASHATSAAGAVLAVATAAGARGARGGGHHLV